MKSTIFALAALISFAAAAPTSQPAFTVASKPFQLFVRSDNATYNGAVLNACHEGAGFEGLCIIPGISSAAESSNTFGFNTTAGSDDGQGIMTYYLPNIASTPLSFPAYASSGNVDHPQFTPSSTYTLLYFGGDDYLATVGSPSNQQLQRRQGSRPLLENWAICHTDVNDYSYVTLNFITDGDTTASNPTCVNAQVQRVFI